MILTLFLALLALSIVVCVLGYFTDDEPYLPVGLTFLFLLSTVIIAGNLQYESGKVAVTNFTYNGSSTLTGQTETTTTTYTSWNDTASHTVGYLLGVISVLGVALSLYNMKNRGAEE